VGDMMKATNVQSIICLVIFFLFANQAWAADWIFYATARVGNMHYDKSSIKKVNKNIIHVWIKTIYSENGKTNVYSILRRVDKTLNNPDILSCDLMLYEIDCVNEKFRVSSSSIFDEKGNVIHTEQSDEWYDIGHDSLKTLKNIVCNNGKTSKSVPAPAPAYYYPAPDAD
jgi:hypothetical protein